LGNNRLSHLIVHSLYLLPTSPSVLHHCRARTLELANSRTADSRTLVFVDWLFSSTDSSYSSTLCRILRLPFCRLCSLSKSSLTLSSYSSPLSSYSSTLAYHLLTAHQSLVRSDSLFLRNSCLKVGASEPNSDHQS
jgi:hypothetical protein